MTARERLGYRRTTVGFIWQQTSRNLLPYLTARQNVMMPMRFSRAGRRAAGQPGRRAARGARCRALRRPHAGADVRRRAAADRYRDGAGQRPAAAARRRADRRAGQRDRAGRVRRAADGQLRAGRDRPGRDPRPGRLRQVRRTIAIRDGRTSSETLRRSSADDHGNAAHHAVEYAVLDRAGRVQLPHDMIEPLGMRDRVRLEAEPDHIGVWPDVQARQRVESSRQIDPWVSRPPRPVRPVAWPPIRRRCSSRHRTCTRTFGSGGTAVQALRGVSLRQSARAS